MGITHDKLRCESCLYFPLWRCFAGNYGIGSPVVGGASGDWHRYFADQYLQSLFSFALVFCDRWVFGKLALFYYKRVASCSNDWKHGTSHSIECIECVHQNVYQDSHQSIKAEIIGHRKDRDHHNQKALDICPCNMGFVATAFIILDSCTEAF